LESFPLGEGRRKKKGGLRCENLTGGTDLLGGGEIHKGPGERKGKRGHRVERSGRLTGGEKQGEKRWVRGNKRRGRRGKRPGHQRGGREKDLGGTAVKRLHREPQKKKTPGKRLPTKVNRAQKRGEDKGEDTKKKSKDAQATFVLQATSGKKEKSWGSTVWRGRGG